MVCLRRLYARCSRGGRHRRRRGGRHQLVRAPHWTRHHSTVSTHTLHALLSTRYMIGLPHNTIGYLLHLGASGLRLIGREFDPPAAPLSRNIGHVVPVGFSYNFIRLF